MKTLGITMTIVARAVSAFAAFSVAVVSSRSDAAEVAQAPSPQPEVSISVRGTWGGEVEAGESFRVAVRVDAPADMTTKLELGPAQGSWMDATTVEILSADGKTVSAAARPVVAATAEAKTAIDSENPASGLWWFPAENLAAVGPGDYVVRARLVIRDGTGWKGEAVSEPAPMRIVPLSADPERIVARKLARARAAIFAGDPAKGSELLNALLEAEPNCVPALALRAALSLEGGNRGGARVCIERALMLATKAGEEPSAELNQLALSIERSAPQKGSPAELPAWTRVPSVVFESVRTERSSIPGLSAPNRSGQKPVEAPARVAGQSTAPVSVAAPATPAVQASTENSLGVVIPSAEFSDAKIVADSAGQWAATATARTQYDQNQYSATRATGAPNVTVAGNSPDAWCPATRGEGIDWLDLTFAKPVQAVEVRVRQNDAPGAIVKIEAMESNGTVHLWWEGVDPYKAGAVREIAWFAVRVPKTSYLVARVKITLNLESGRGYKQIDAVQLVAAP